MSERKDKLALNPNVVREFALEGSGNFEDLSERMRRTHIAWVTSFAEDSAVIGYPVGAASEELVGRIVQAALECGFQITKTRSRVVRGSGIVMPNEHWKDFAEFLADRQVIVEVREALSNLYGDNLLRFLPPSHTYR
jgi:hypothetical protein